MGPAPGLRVFRSSGLGAFRQAASRQVSPADLASASCRGLVSEGGETLDDVARVEKNALLWFTTLRTEGTRVLAAIGDSGSRMEWGNGRPLKTAVAELMKLVT